MSRDYRHGHAIWGSLVMGILLTFTGSTFAQMRGGMMGGPSFPGLFNPKVGAGAVYAMADARGQSHEMEIAVVGKEEVSGTPAYWMEISFTGGPQGEMVMKYLMANQGGAMHIYRVIMSNPQMGVMEMPEMMLSRIQQGISQSLSTSDAGMGKNLGTEVIVTKAGPEKCTHWQKETQGGTADVWVNGDIYPTSLVKSVYKGQYGTTTMELIRQVSDAKTKITGEPKKMEMPGMPPGR